ncbi:MAG: methionyl-tRNA formyltransferase [Bacteriovoracaceae bacterium]|nr:methionyl-tRNA formyltransferase [Bacteriovoracaceae bacterium]
MKKIKVIFFGTPDFAVPSLDIINNHPHVELIGVVSMPDRKSGRGHRLKSPEVIEYAKNNKLAYFQSENINKDDKFEDFVKEADVFIVLAFAQFLSQKILDLPKNGCFNIHTSVLPKYRGAAPIQYALLNGDNETGVSIQKMVKKMDAGDVCFEKSVAIAQTETGGQLYTRLKYQAALSLNEFIYNIVEKNINYRTQDETQVSIAPTLKRENGFLDFKNETFETLNNKVRALYPWPGTYCMQGKKRVKVFTIEKSNIKLEPGQTLIQNKQLLVGCKDTSIRLMELQLEGKKRSYDYDIVNGFRSDFKLNEES